MKLFSIFFIAAVKTLFAYSLLLINDSPFELTAIVQSANGTFLGQESLQPNEQRQWSTDMNRTDLKDIFDVTESLTPFTVIWKCSYKGYYSICTDISPGATVFAQAGSGTKECLPRPKKKDQKE